MHCRAGQWGGEKMLPKFKLQRFQCVNQQMVQSLTNLYAAHAWLFNSFKASVSCFCNRKSRFLIEEYTHTVPSFCSRWNSRGEKGENANKRDLHYIFPFSGGGQYILVLFRMVGVLPSFTFDFLLDIGYQFIFGGLYWVIFEEKESFQNSWSWCFVPFR